MANRHLFVFGTLLVLTLIMLWTVSAPQGTPQPVYAQAEAEQTVPARLEAVVTRADLTLLDTVVAKAVAAPAVETTRPCVEPLQELAQSTVVTFAANTQTPDAESVEQARALLQALSGCDAAVVTIQGHVGRHLQEVANLRESWAIAEAVIAEMGRAGFDVARLHPVGFGSRHMEAVAERDAIVHFSIATGVGQVAEALSLH